MLSQNFQIVPQGYLKSGTASLQRDETTGATEAIEDINAQVMFIPKELKSDSNFKADPKMFLSASIVKGLKFVVGSVQAEVTQVKPGIAAVVSLKMSDHSKPQTIDGEGSIALNLKGQYWTISHIVLNATIGGLPFIGTISQIIEAKPI
jgi:hypothetical protein